MLFAKAIEKSQGKWAILKYYYEQAVKNGNVLKAMSLNKRMLKIEAAIPFFSGGIYKSNFK